MNFYIRYFASFGVTGPSCCERVTKGRDFTAIHQFLLSRLRFLVNMDLVVVSALLRNNLYFTQMLRSTDSPQILASALETHGINKGDGLGDKGSVRASDKAFDRDLSFCIQWTQFNS